jgi:hypothetical protein
LRRLGLSFLADEAHAAAAEPPPAETIEDQSDPYLSQTARLSASGRAFPPAPDPTETV